jgi:hypothetical protein
LRWDWEVGDVMGLIGEGFSSERYPLYINLKELLLAHVEGKKEYGSCIVRATISNNDAALGKGLAETRKSKRRTRSSGRDRYVEKIGWS